MLVDYHAFLQSAALLITLTSIILFVCICSRIFIITDCIFECVSIHSHKMSNSLQVVFDYTSKQQLISDTVCVISNMKVAPPTTECLNVDVYKLLSHRKQGI